MPIDAVWMAVAVALPALGALIAPLSTIDLAYQVRTGDEIIAVRAIPAVDAFTFSAAGLPWTVQQWGAAVALAVGFAPAGWTGLLVLRALLVGATFALMLAACRLRGASARTAALLTLAAFVVAIGALGLRAQLFGVLCFAAVLALTGARHRMPRLYLLTPVILLAWANMHGSFPLGLLAIGWALLEDLARDRRAWTRDGIILAASAAATCLTPYGPGVWAYAAGLVRTPAVAGLVSEWQPVTLRSVEGLALAVSAAFVACAVALRGRRPLWPLLAWLAALLLLALWAERWVVWWGIGSMVAVAGVLAAAPAGSSAPATDSTAPARRPSVANGVLALAILLAPVVVAVGLLARPSDPVAGPPGLLSDAPAGVTRAVRSLAGPGTRILNAQRWGSWLEWAVPGAPVFVDSRFEVVPEDAWRDYVALSDGRFDWRERLARIDPDLIVTPRAELSGLLDAIEADPAAGWRTVYADDDGVVLAR